MTDRPQNQDRHTRMQRKIATITSLDELRGFLWGLSKWGAALTDPERADLARRKIELQRKGA